MNDLYTYAAALGTLQGHIQGIRISYELGSSDLDHRLERLFQKAEEIDAALNTTVRQPEEQPS